MSYLARILPYIPAELDETLDERACNWALPNGLQFRSYEGVTEVFGSCTDVYICIDWWDYYRTVLVLNPGHYSCPMEFEDAMWLLYISDCIKQAEEIGLPSYDLRQKFGRGVNHALKDFPEDQRPQLQDAMLELFNIA
jgi:hypothetical protein